MERSLERQIREHLVDYLAGQTPLDDFKVWLASVTWEADAPPATIRLANHIKVVLAEHSSGFTDDVEMHNELRDLLQHGEVVLAATAPLRPQSGSSSESIIRRLTFPEPVVGTPRASVSVS
jgi:hypothetical protein